jgi:hypothetical protein
MQGAFAHIVPAWLSRQPGKTFFYTRKDIIQFGNAYQYKRRVFLLQLVASYVQHRLKQSPAAGLRQSAVHFKGRTCPEDSMTSDGSSAFNDVSNDRIKVAAAIRAIRTNISFRIIISKTSISQSVYKTNRRHKVIINALHIQAG